MLEHAASSVSCIAFCWQLERRDGAGIGLTSSDVPISFDGHRFDPAPGLLPAAIVRGQGPGERPAEAHGALTAHTIREDDLLAGRWDGARARFFAVDGEDADGTAVPLVEGELGEVSSDGLSFQADLLGAASKLNVSPCPQTSPECRARFGDKACRVDLAGRSERRRVVELRGSTLVMDGPCEAAFSAGRLRWLGGANCGSHSVILAVDGDNLHLRDLPRLPVHGGETVMLREGCDKRFATCVDRFNNAANFRGEPHLPGNDLLTRYPGA